MELNGTYGTRVAGEGAPAAERSDRCRQAGLRVTARPGEAMGSVPASLRLRRVRRGTTGTTEAATIGV